MYEYRTDGTLPIRDVCAACSLSGARYRPGYETGVLHLVEHSEQQSVDAVYCDVTMRIRHDEVDRVRLTVLVLVVVLDLDSGLRLG
jgi:hypothetical protein